MVSHEWILKICVGIGLDGDDLVAVVIVVDDCSWWKLISLVVSLLHAISTRGLV